MNWFKHGWKLKIISFGLALGLWYYAVNEESVEMTRMIPLQVTIQNQNMSILNVSSEVLRVTFKAPRSMISELASADIRLQHALDEEVNQAGEYSFRPDAAEIFLPSLALHVLKIEPPVVQVVVDELVTRELPIKPFFQGVPALGYKVRDEEIQLDPNAIMIQGPKGEVEKMTSILTRPVSLTGRTRSFRMTSDFQLPESVTPLSSDNADLYVAIHEVSQEKELSDIQVKMIRPSGALGLAELSPQKVTIQIQGPPRVLQNLTSDKMHAYADLSGLDYGDHEVAVSWVFPPGVSLKDDKKIKVTASIRREA